MILFVGFRLFSAYSISGKKLAHTPHKIFLCIVIPYVNRNATPVESVLKDFEKVQSRLGSYGIEIREKCLGVKNMFYGSSAIVRFHRREEVSNDIILVLVRPSVR